MERAKTGINMEVTMTEGEGGRRGGQGEAVFFSDTGRTQMPSHSLRWRRSTPGGENRGRGSGRLKVIFQMRSLFKSNGKSQKTR